MNTNYCLCTVELANWGKLVASARIERNPYFREEGEPELLMSQIEVYQNEECRNVWKGLSQPEKADVEEALAQSFYTSEENEKEVWVDFQIQTALENA